MIIYVVKAKTKWSGHELNGVSNLTSDLPGYFKDWVEKNNLKSKNIWYADVYRVDEGGNGELIGFFELTEDGNVLMDIDEENGKTVNAAERWLRRFGRR